MNCPVSHWKERCRYLDELDASELGPSLSYVDYRVDDLRRRSLLVREEFDALLAGGRMHRSPDIVGHSLGHRMVMPSVVRKHLEQLLCLQGDAQVSLGRLNQDEMAIRRYHEDPVLRLWMMRQLHRLGLLRFPKSWCWRVDRNAAEYDQRFGFRTIDLLYEFTGMDEDVNGPRVLLEWGAGSGNFKSEVERELGNEYVCFAVSDAIYIPPEKLAARLLNMQLLAADIGAHEVFDAAAFAEFATLVTLQQAGTCDTDVPRMDDEVMADIDANLKAFVHHLKRKAGLLATTESVRDPGGVVREGQLVYPVRKAKASVPYLVDACEAFARDPGRYLPLEHMDAVLAAVPAHIPGMLPASFEHVPGKLASSSVNASLAVRSTEYVPAETYVEFQADVARILHPQGIAIDDSVRRNHGAGHRLAELRDIEQRIGFPLHVIFGPGQPGEDRHGEPVPHAFVMTRDPRKITLIESSLFDGYLMRPLSAMPA